MRETYQSEIFRPTLLLWKMFGIWPGRSPSKIYKYYTIVYLFVNLFVYNIFLTLNLIYTPLNIDAFIQEVIFYFTEVVVTTKVFMVIVKRNNILKIFDYLNSEEFQGDSGKCKKIIENSCKKYKTCWILYVIMANLSYFSQVLAPLLLNWVHGTTAELELPICKYYFLSVQSRETYFVWWFIYQSLGMYGHMTYNITCDLFITGILLLMETQLRVINYKLVNLHCKITHVRKNGNNQEIQEMLNLKKCLRHYDDVIKFCSTVQDLINVTMFLQFGVGSTIICVTMYSLLLPSKTETMVFMVIYFMAITLQIFMPALLGSMISHESQQLVFAAYNTNWTVRSMPFRRNIMIFTERAKIPIQMTGMKMFPLSLLTFTSIMKTAYSLFTLIGNVQEANGGSQ